MTARFIRSAADTYSIQLVGISDPFQHGVALKVVEEFEVVVAGDAKDLERAVSELFH